MNSKQAIGGYFELELRQYDNFIHKNAVLLNSGRNAFVYILESLAVRKIHIPRYICSAMLQPLRQLQIDYAFYAVNEDLEPDQSLTIRRDEHLLYINYFGLKSAAVQELTKKYPNIIIDNAQAFFCSPYHRRPTFYSPRKFFGVPDGGIAYTNTNEGIPRDEPPEETSYERCAHLLKRIELGAREGFSDYKSNEREFENRSLARMSRLTKKLLFNIDYNWVRSRRNTNFIELHSALQAFNQLSHIIDSDSITGPMMYPYLSDNSRHLREHLHKHNIFTPTYWPQISESGNGSNAFARYLAEHLIPLPIDQRYRRCDMRRIVSVIEKCHG